MSTDVIFALYNSDLSVSFSPKTPVSSKTPRSKTPRRPVSNKLKDPVEVKKLISFLLMVRNGASFYPSKVNHEDLDVCMYDIDRCTSDQDIKSLQRFVKSDFIIIGNRSCRFKPFVDHYYIIQSYGCYQEVSYLQ